MALDITAYAASKRYTDVTVEGGGAIKGKNCTIDSITPITGGNRVTFKWTLDSGTVQTDTMDVMDGEDGKGIKRVYVNEEDHLIIVYDDDTTSDAGEIIVQSSVDSVNGKTGEVVLNASDVGALPNDTTIPSKTSDLTNDSNFVADASYVHTDNNYDATAKGIVDGVTTALADKVDKVTGKGLSENDYTDADKAIVDGVTTALSGKVDKNGTDSLMTADEHTKLSGIAAGAEVNVQSDWEEANSSSDAYIANKPNIPTKTSDLTNDSGFIANTVNDLVNYYTKTQTYTQSEVDALISAIVTLNISVVAELPTTNISTTTIYLVPSADPGTQNVKDEYINLDGTTAGWELIGSTAIDLSNYVTDDDLTTALADYVTSTSLTTTLADYVQKSQTAGLLKNDGTVDTNTYATTSALTDYIQKSQTAGLVKNDGTIDTTTYVSDISGKADKVTSATAGNIAGLDSSGNIVDSNISSNDIRKTTMLSNNTSNEVIFKISGFELNTGSLFVIRARGGESILFALGNSSQDVAISYGYSAFRISGHTAYKINAMIYDYTNNELYVNLGSYSILSIIQISGVIKYDLTITSVNSIPATDIYEIPIQNLNSKADKVTSATNGNFAGLDSNGNLTDSGSKASDFLGQVDTMPTASADNYKKIVQYIGATDTYTHGYFYECTRAMGTQLYYWMNVPVSEGSGGGHVIEDTDGNTMTQRAGLQFEGMGVTDDSTNDKTVVTLPTPDYVDEQFNPSTTYSKGMTCIEGNVRYRYKNSTATSGHRPPDTTYWEVYSVADEIKGSTEHVLYDSGNKTSSDWTNDTTNNRYVIQIGQTAGVAQAVTDGASAYGRDRVFIVMTMETGAAVTNYCIPAYIPKTATTSGKFDQIMSVYPVATDTTAYFNFPISTVNSSQIYLILAGSGRSTWVGYTWRFRIIAFS